MHVARGRLAPLGRAAAVVVGAWLAVGAALAQDEPTPSPAIARVAGVDLYAYELAPLLAPLAERKGDDAAVRDRLRSAARERLIDQQLALGFLQANGLAASDDDVRLELAVIDKQLAQQQLTRAEYLKRAGRREDELRRTVAWRLSWDRFLAGRLTDDNLEKFFASRCREFDGTQLRVAHIVWPAPAPATAADVESLVKQADEAAAQIALGELSFAEAARRYSQSPTADRGGDIGWIGRHEPMPPSFSRAAFALEVGQVSPPVTTPLGVHLIRVLEVKPGERTLADVRPEVRQAAAEYLLRWTADRQRPNAAIERFPLPPAD